MSNPPLDALKELLLVSGILLPDEVSALSGDLSFRVQTPYGLTAPVIGGWPPPALRWAWRGDKPAEFCAWVVGTLARRFGIAISVVPEDADAPGQPVHLLKMRLGEREEVCDWAYLNTARWMGAFGTIAARLLGPAGVIAVELETGDFDTVLLFCRVEHVEALREWLPLAE